MSDLRSIYGDLRDKHLIQIAEKLVAALSDTLSDLPRIDRITARAKEVDSFLEKSAREEGGEKKYSDPLSEIQDQIGARIIVLFKYDVEIVRERISKYFKYIERKSVAPADRWKFGYFGEHSIVFLPAEVLPDDAKGAELPKFFELQIKTVFQHAWSEAEHDLAYKAPKGFREEMSRELAFTSAQAWGADKIFDEVFRTIHGLEAANDRRAEDN